MFYTVQYQDYLGVTADLDAKEIARNYWLDQVDADEAELMLEQMFRHSYLARQEQLPDELQLTCDQHLREMVKYHVHQFLEDHHQNPE
jgi:hypothetical protein